MQNYQKPFEKDLISKHDLKFIDGKIRGCAKCVGHCSYKGHPGYLTQNQRRDHDCIKKSCVFYTQKPKLQRERTKVEPENHILNAAINATKDLEGMKVLGVDTDNTGNWTVYYIAISKYILDTIEKNISEAFDCRITMKQVKCDFEKAASMIF